jgi:predicted ribosome quality control (RQC) complex YloA/Tae2 family protein
MKTVLSPKDVAGLALQIDAFAGTRLQEIHTENNIVALGLWGDGYCWLIVDLSAQSPNLWAQEAAPTKSRLKKNPVYLFLKSHVVNHKLEKVSWAQEYGRVLSLEFSGGSIIEIRLFPHGQNVIVKHDQKQVAWQKPAVLQALKDVPETTSEISLPLFLDERQGDKTEATEPSISPELSQKNKVTEAAQSVQKKIIQLEKSIEKVNIDINNKMQKPFFEVANWLKANGHMNGPAEFNDWLDTKKSFSWNMNHLYEQHKQRELKIQNAQKRLMQLNGELSELKNIDINDSEAVSAISFKSDKLQNSKASNSNKTVTKYSGRTLQIDDTTSVVVGKSGTDNLNILRLSQPWDIWLHLRDYPSAHAVLRRQKNQNLKDAVLFAAAQFLLRCHFGQKENQYKGDKFEVIYSECRFVRPVKGDHHGRVTHSHTRSILVQKT